MTEFRMDPFIDEIVLASLSPRRQELLRQIGVRFRPVAASVEETPISGETDVDYVRRIAAAKSATGLAITAGTLPVLAADTEVVLDGRVLGKPRDLHHEVELLSQLSDRTHRVLTAVSLRSKDRHWLALSESEVSMRALQRAEIESYWATGEPCDKAGGYAIQGQGALFIRHIAGSYSGVMGLPLFETAALLKNVGINPLGLSGQGQRADER